MGMALAKEAQKSIKRLLAALRRELDSLDADLDEMVATVAAMRKLLTILNAMLKTNTDWTCKPA